MIINFIFVRRTDSTAHQENRTRIIEPVIHSVLEAGADRAAHINVGNDIASGEIVLHRSLLRRKYARITPEFDFLQIQTDADCRSNKSPVR